MTTNILSPHWTGDTAAPVNPETIRFTAAQAPHFRECDGCLFVSQRASVCSQASAIAVAAGHPDCDDVLPGRRTVIYVLDRSDPRQMPLAARGH
jgi:hypothetical protein